MDKLIGCDSPFWGIVLDTRLKGRIALTPAFHRDIVLNKDKSLYKFIWVKSGRLSLEIDHVPVKIEEGEVVSLAPLQRLRICDVSGEYFALLFNSNFYCIFGHDDEVSCNGLLFNGTSRIMRLKLSENEIQTLNDLVSGFVYEYEVKDSFREEMFRILLKRIIIFFTRIARRKFSITQEKEKSFEIVRQYYVLVDLHFREKKQVQDYADMLCRSPKTLSNLFSVYGLPSPLRIIHERLEAEAKRLLLYTSKSAKEIAAILGFEDQASFSRFFKNMAGMNVSEYRKSINGNN
ncbi:helix-turn-helix domain-containing protein [Coprobacter sp.]